MNKNKIYLALAVLAVAGMIGQYISYESQVEAQSLSKYQITYDSKQDARNIILQEEAKGCSKLHTDYSNKDGTQGILTFTCDDRTPTPQPQRQLTREDLLQELASERNVELTGRAILP